MKKTIILDRDGVINHDSDYYIKTPDEWLPITDSLQAIANLTKKDIPIYIATNQSGIARGLFTEDTLNKIFDKMKTSLAKIGGKINDIVFCPHHPNDNCECRKPKPGLLQKLQKKYQFNFNEAIFIGDSLKDIQAAQAVNMPVFLVKTGKGLNTINDNLSLINQVPIFENLHHAVEFILSMQNTIYSMEK